MSKIYMLRIYKQIGFENIVRIVIVSLVESLVRKGLGMGSMRLRTQDRGDH